MTVLMAISAVLCALALGMTLRNLAVYRRRWTDWRGAGAGPGEAVLVSVCIPARNEAANLESCVRSVLAQTHVRVEVLVYDDQSTDATPEILARLAAADARVVRVATEPLPPGWNGKQWGCDRMGRAAKGEWMLFTDADVRLNEACIERTLGEALARGADLLSTFPRQVLGTLGEALLVPMIHFVLFSYLPMDRMRRTADPSTSAACGQFVFVRREAWLATGGHGAFRDSMHDGVKMPRAFRRAGLRTDLFDGAPLASCRMYDGFAASWRGFAKNAFEGLGSMVVLLVFTAMHVVGHLAPWAYLLVAGLGGGLRPWPAALAIAAIVCAFAQRLVLAVAFRQPLVCLPLHPLAVALMTAIQWRSWWLHVRGRRAWRGRVGATGASGLKADTNPR